MRWQNCTPFSSLVFEKKKGKENEKPPNRRKWEHDSAYGIVSKHLSDLPIEEKNQWQTQAGSIRLIRMGFYSSHYGSGTKIKFKNEKTKPNQKI